MADTRPIWRGHLRLALVSCPVALFNAHHERGSLHFHLLNPKTGNRIRMITRDAETGEELRRGDLARAFELGKNDYVTLTDEDFEAARIPSSSVMTLEKFVEAGDIDPVYFESPYYLAPDGEAGEDVYRVLREAFARTGRMAITRVVLSQRERVLALAAHGAGMIAHVLREQKDLNDAGAIFSAVPGPPPEPRLLDLAVELIDRETGRFDPADFEDRYEAKLRAIIDAKAAGRTLPPHEDRPPGGNVVDLMEALRRSLAGVAAERATGVAAERATGGAADGKAPAGAAERTTGGAARRPPPAGAEKPKRPRRRA